MYGTNEILTRARRLSIGATRTGLFPFRTPEVALDCGIGGSNKRLLVVIGSEKTEAYCLDFARRFASPIATEIHTMKAFGWDSAGEVRRRATALEADWLCMVTHGGPGLMTLFLKSEDERILRAAPCPVICIPEPLRHRQRTAPTDAALQPIKRILVPTVARNKSRIMSSAVALATRFGAKIDLLQVEERGAQGLVRNDDPLPADEKLIPKPLRGRKAARLGLPLFYATINAAREFRSDLIVLETPVRCWTNHARIDVGTERILRSAPCPVVCIPDQYVAGAVRRCE